MSRHWTFGQKIGSGFTIVILLTIAIVVIALLALQNIVEEKDQILDINAQSVLEAEKVLGLMEAKSASARAFLLTREDRWTDEIQSARTNLRASLGHLRSRAMSEETRKLIGDIERFEQDHQDALDAVILLRKGTATVESVSRAFDEQVVPKRGQLHARVKDYIAAEGRLQEAADKAADQTVQRTVIATVSFCVIAILVAASVATFLTRSLGKQIGTAITQVQSSAAELQAAANQQATGAKEQATAMNEITTTISELLATSSQIAEGAQRVSHIADQTSGGARSGAVTVDKANEAIGGIRRQVDQIVGHMLELGKKSQQIGAVLDIVSELSEQTNILAINATIEAAGAGDSGKRFAVVADEIRKLADRVGGSTKEIRNLIDDVRSAVNTTVMATETGSKAVDLGAKHFTEVTSSFKQIADLVGTTTEAAREIELSTKQQATAVQQVNIAVANTAQAAKETEASSAQTLQTATQLASLSKDLFRLVRPLPVA